MTRRFKFFLAMLSICVSMPAFASSSAVGYWKTIDDESGEAKSIVKISESADHIMTGRVVRLFKQAHKRCDNCKGEKHNQPIKGMQVMMGLIKDRGNASRWIDGEILDPKSGKIYNCNITLEDHGNKLKVRGYIGVPLFGRSQVWERVPSAG